MRKTIQIYSPLKSLVQDIKTELDFKNESEVIAYLIAIRTVYKDKITLTQHQEALKIADEILSQQTL